MPQYDAELEGQHRRSSNHREQILASAICGCFYCCETFAPTEIEEWVDELDGVGTTALCPRCGIDSVLGFERAEQVNPDFLRRMHGYWFS